MDSPIEARSTTTALGSMDSARLSVWPSTCPSAGQASRPCGSRPATVFIRARGRSGPPPWRAAASPRCSAARGRGERAQIGVGGRELPQFAGRAAEDGGGFREPGRGIRSVRTGVIARGGALGDDVPVLELLRRVQQVRVDHPRDQALRNLRAVREELVEASVGAHVLAHGVLGDLRVRRAAGRLLIPVERGGRGDRGQHRQLGGGGGGAGDVVRQVGAHRAEALAVGVGQHIDRVDVAGASGPVRRAGS